MMFKKKSVMALLAVMCVVVVSTSFVACSNNEYDKALKSYEKTVVAIEKAAKSNNTKKLLKLSEKFEEQGKALDVLFEENEHWTEEQWEKYVELYERSMEVILDFDYGF
ncbi:MAG: hypothetical protein J6V57_06615 [Spirochaetaceae bacterium]|nr:hypothetical protein [Spirochaetaceae bacterium]